MVVDTFVYELKGSVYLLRGKPDSVTPRSPAPHGTLAPTTLAPSPSTSPVVVYGVS